jgi:hypothetical protein
VTNSNATPATPARNMDGIPRTIKSNENMTLDSSQNISNGNDSINRTDGSRGSSDVSGQEDDDEVYSLAKDLDGVLNLRAMVDTDQATTYAPGKHSALRLNIHKTY